jgi:hypothetical protein
MWIFLDWNAFVFWAELRYGINAILCDDVIIKLNENILSFLTSLSYFCYELLRVFRKYADWIWAHGHPNIHKPHKVMSAVKEGFASSWLRHRRMDRLLGQYSDAYLILLSRPKYVFNSSRSSSWTTLGIAFIFLVGSLGEYLRPVDQNIERSALLCLG